jgi:hypothetical protein
MPEATEGQRIVLDLPVNSAAPVQGRYGPQWELQVQYPWSKYPQKAWIQRVERDSPIEPGTYRCIIERGGMIDPAKGQVEWNYKRTIVQFDVGDSLATSAQPAAQVPYQTTVTNQPTAYVDPEIARRASIEKQVALKAAVEFACARVAQGEPPDQHLHILEYAASFYGWLAQKDERERLQPTIQSEDDAEAEYLAEIAAQAPMDEAPHPADAKHEQPTD